MPERKEILQREFPAIDIGELGHLPNSVAENMIENCVGQLSIPLGVIPRILVNDKWYTVPIALEEPSVVAAASAAAKLVSTFGSGFRGGADPENIMISQVQLRAVENPKEATKTLLQHSEELISIANRFCLGMVERGGGVRDISIREIALPEDGASLVVHLHVDVCNAMGANTLNSIAEGIAPELQRLVGGTLGLRILSNLCPMRLAWSSFQIPAHVLERDGVSGREIAERIHNAAEFANADIYRACTHNKGILNGIGGVALATGQDWRAIEAAAHAFACLDGSYGALSEFSATDDFLCGKLTIPLAVGVRGGSVSSHPGYMQCLEMLGSPSAQELAVVMASVGLAQNLAALRALCSEGIQLGHMALHARNVAMSSGAIGAEVAVVADFLRSGGRERIMRGSNAATQFVDALRYWREGPGEGMPCSLTFEAESGGANLLLFETPEEIGKPIHLSAPNRRLIDVIADRSWVSAQMTVQLAADPVMGDESLRREAVDAVLHRISHHSGMMLLVPISKP